MKPAALTVNEAGIPHALKADARWVCWESIWQQSDGKADRWTKLPRQTNGRAAKSDNPSTWTTFVDAYAAYRRGGFDGVGFMLGDGWAGIDLDDILSGPIVDRLSCYVETSPSGTGLKAFGRSRRIGGEIKPTGSTTWTSGRMFAVTGLGSGDATADLTPLINEWFPLKTVPRMVLGDKPAFIRDGDVRGTENIERLTDDQVVVRILVSSQADKFIRLVKGDTSDYGDDHSRADQALCTILAYWCCYDIDQVDRLFRQSGLMRDKWNSTSYRRATLLKAVQR
jgi:primase-polymerase (primpol)-like protein